MTFINNGDVKITLQEETEYEPEDNSDDERLETEDTGYFTRLWHIYIKQGRSSGTGMVSD